MRKYFLVLGLLIFISCKRIEEPFGINFYFENPQPTKDSELLKIPNRFQGLFMDSDSVYINVQENIILKEYHLKFRLDEKDLDSIKNDFDKIGDKYISKINKDVYEVKYLKDSIEFSKKQIDTFFLFSNFQKAKRFDGKLILNYRDSIFWKIKSICLEKNSLKIKYIYSEQDLKLIDSLIKLKSIMVDSSSVLIKPSRKEFKKLLNMKNLGEEFTYQKVK